MTELRVAWSILVQLAGTGLGVFAVTLAALFALAFLLHNPNPYDIRKQ